MTVAPGALKSELGGRAESPTRAPHLEPPQPRDVRTKLFVPRGASGRWARGPHTLHGHVFGIGLSSERSVTSASSAAFSSSSVLSRQASLTWRPPYLPRRQELPARTPREISTLRDREPQHRRRLCLDSQAARSITSCWTCRALRARSCDRIRSSVATATGDLFTTRWCIIPPGI